MDDKSKLLAEREKLVERIKQLNKQGPAGKSASALAFHQEDLKALAKKVIAIDKKLGRV